MLPGSVISSVDAVEEEISKVLDGLTEAEDEAIGVKDVTFVWIYLIQWVAVSGTTMICDFILWSLMIRRRFYREVTSTRLM